MLRRSIGLTFSPSQLILTFTPLGVLTRYWPQQNEQTRAMAPVIAFRGRPKQDNETKAMGLLLVGLSESDPCPMGGDTTIIKIVLAFRPTCIAAAVDWAELAMWITVEIAKESWQQSPEQLASGSSRVASSRVASRS